MDWGTVIARLVAGGHRLDDVREYTLDQIEAFSLQIIRQKKQEVLGMSLAIGLALGGSKEDVQKFLDE